jgi:hypothetical protein
MVTVDNEGASEFSLETLATARNTSGKVTVEELF